MKKFLMVLLSIAFVLNLTIVIGLIGGYDGNSCTESGAAGEQKKGSNTGRAAKIRFGVRNAH